MAKAYLNKNDLLRLQKKMNQLRNLDRQGLSNLLGAFAHKTEEEMKNEFPSILLNPQESTGDLQRSISATAQNKKVVFEAGMKYAPYVEFGTGRLVNLQHLEKLGIPKSYAMKFKGRGIRQVNLPARPFFFTTLRRQMKRLLKSIDKKIKKLT